MDKNKKTILVITGPTASGKTSFAIKCAKLFDGEIISCDSMQIYKDLNVGTAKATDEEQREVKHHLIDVKKPNEEYSVEEFVKETKQIIDELTTNNKLPIIVGGTGLYVRSLIYPYSFCSAPKNEEIRNKYNNLLKENGKEYIYSLLQNKDEEASKRIHINDTKRVIRALEVCEITNESKTYLNQNDTQETIYNVILVVLNLNREELYNRINLRVDKMFEEGLVKEFEEVVKKYSLTSSDQSMQAIGYKELFSLNKNNLEETKELIKQHTRNYAKRQITFFKGFKNLTTWFDAIKEQEQAINYIKLKLDEVK